MSEIAVETAVNEETKPEIPANEPPVTNETGIKTDLFEKIKSTANDAFTRAGGAFKDASNAVKNVVKRGRGRPRNDGKPGKLDVLEEIAEEINHSPGPENSGGDNLAPPASVATLFKPGLIKRCISAVFKGILAVPNSKLEAKAVQKGYSKYDAEKLVSRAAPTEDEIESIAEFTEVLLQELKIDAENKKYIPYIVIGSISAGIGLRYQACFAELKKHPDIKKENQSARA